LILAFD